MLQVTGDIRQRITENMDREELAVWFEALDGIRESGQVNMLESANILRNSGLEGRLASAVARAWMATFSFEATMEQRVEEAYCAVYARLKHEGENT